MDWIDRWAKRAATRVEVTPVAAPHPKAGVTRRTFLKRAATIGTAAWTVPALQSVAAPAFAASGCSQVVCGIGAGCPLCSAGVTCSVNGECITGICAGVCQPGGAGTSCATNGDCITGICGGGTCQPGGISTPCASNGDCTAGQCSGRNGGPKTCGGPGSTCGGATGCTNSNCNGISCGGLGATCTSAAQCRTLFGIDLRCPNGRCTF